jgi:hypothetical protein
MDSVFVIYKSTEEGGFAVGYVHNEKKAQEIVATHNAEIEMFAVVAKEYHETLRNNKHIISKYIEKNEINFEKIEYEYDQLKKKPKPDVSKVPVEKQATVLANWFKKYGSRIQELEKYLSMSVLDMKEHNKKVIKDAHALVPDMPKLKEPIDSDTQYYYEELEELIFH